MNRRMSDQIRQFALVNCRGIVERPTSGRLGFLCNRCHYGSIHLFLLWCCLCFAYLCNTALADFTSNDSATLVSIEYNSNQSAQELHTIRANTANVGTDLSSVRDNASASAGRLLDIKNNTDRLEGQLDTLHDDMSDVHRYIEATVSGNRVGNWQNLITGGTFANPLSILQQLDYMRYNLMQVTNLMVKLAATNDYTKAFTNTINSINFVIEQADLINQNLGNFVNGYSLEDSDGNGYDNRISGTHYGNSSITMSDALQFIAQGVGGIDTAGNPHYQTQAMMPLINTILGWSGGFSNNNIHTNGIIGLLRQANSYLSEMNSLTNLVVEKIDEQINIVSNGFAKIVEQMGISVHNETNMLYLLSRPFNGGSLIGQSNNYYAFLKALESGVLTYTNQVDSNPFWPMLLSLPVPMNELEYLSTPQRQAIGQMAKSFGFGVAGSSASEGMLSLAQSYHSYYGNMRTLSDATAGLGLDSEMDSEVDEVKSHYTNESEDITFDLDSDLASVLQGPWAQPNQQLNSIKRNTSMDKSINDFKYLVRDALVEEEQSGGFGFSITFDGSENSNTIEFDRDTLFADSEFLARVKTTIDGYLDYITWIVKGGLILILGWRSATTAMNVMGDGSV